jgi:hypothetical protein
MPAWVAQLGQLLLGIAALLFGVGFLTIVWKVAWAMRGWVDAEKDRAHMNEELMALVKEFVKVQVAANDEQRRMNEQFSTGIRALGSRLGEFEKDREMGQ